MQQKLQETQASTINLNENFAPLSIQKFKCPNNNCARLVCVSQKCQHPGLMCVDFACQCKQKHNKCHNLLLSNIVQTINKHQKKVPEEIKLLYSSIYKIIDKLIDQLSEIKYSYQAKENYFGLHDEQIQLVGLIYKQKMQAICGKLVNKIEPFLQKQKIYDCYTSDFIQKDFQRNKSHFDVICQRLKSYGKQKSYGNLQKDLAPLSKVATNQQKMLLFDWVYQQFDCKHNNMSSKLLYRASDHAFSLKKFHQLCDQHNNTLLLVRTQFDKKIGGFNPNKWKGQKDDAKLIDEKGKSFIFSLTQKQKYECVNRNESITYKVGAGPVFGNYGQNGDIQIRDGESRGYFPNCYNSKMHKYQNNQQSYNKFSGAINSYSFKIKQWEIYKIQGLQ